jgi:catechol 2,3-dioxygenase-like lactoylglutathione lyase family enzyme
LIARPHHLGLRHLALRVRDLDAMTAFYVELLGFHVEWQPDADNVYLSSGSDNLALHRDGGVKGTTGSDTALDHLGVVVGAPSDVDLWAGFLEARGVGLEDRPRTHRDGARSCYVRDPDGNRVQIIFHPPISSSP